MTLLGHREGSRSPCIRKGAAGRSLVDLLKLHVHHRPPPPIFTWTGFLFGMRGLEGLGQGGG